LKVRPPAGQAWTPADSSGQGARDRGPAAVADGPERPGAAPECQTVSALVARALAALNRGDVAETRALLRAAAASAVRIASKI